jgi:uncharacterized paraquat-inducible protein A
MNIAFCPECENRVKLGGRPRLGQQNVCRRCRARLAVVRLEPLELRLSRGDSGGSSRRKPLAEALCPECDSIVSLEGRLIEGETIACPACHTELTVVGLNPLELDIPIADISRWVKKR